MRDRRPIRAAWGRKEATGAALLRDSRGVQLAEDMKRSASNQAW